MYAITLKLCTQSLRSYVRNHTQVMYAIPLKLCTQSHPSYEPNHTQVINPITPKFPSLQQRRPIALVYIYKQKMLEHFYAR